MRMGMGMESVIFIPTGKISEGEVSGEGLWVERGTRLFVIITCVHVLISFLHFRIIGSDGSQYCFYSRTMLF